MLMILNTTIQTTDYTKSTSMAPSTKLVLTCPAFRRPIALRIRIGFFLTASIDPATVRKNCPIWKRSALRLLNAGLLLKLWSALYTTHVVFETKYCEVPELQTIGIIIPCFKFAAFRRQQLLYTIRSLVGQQNTTQNRPILSLRIEEQNNRPRCSRRQTRRTDGGRYLAADLEIMKHSIDRPRAIYLSRPFVFFSYKLSENSTMPGDQQQPKTIWTFVQPHGDGLAPI